jgi:membrane-associated protease RseP (regulator of RpoE activity)
VTFARGIVVFIVLLTASVAWHELGHLAPAKLFGVRVNQYMVGFGPTLFSRRRGDTEYGVKLIPLGGYIRMAAMYPPEAGPSRRPRARWRAQLETEVRAASAAEVAQAGQAGSFYRLSAPRKIVVMLGGPTMNLILAFVLFAAVFAGLGQVGATTTVDSVAPCVTAGGQWAECPDAADAPGGSAGPGAGVGVMVSPAAAAGIEAGDRIVEWDGRAIERWEDVTAAIQWTDGQDVDAVVERDGQRVALRIAPVLVGAADAAGGDAAGGDAAGQRAVIGVTAAIGDVRQPLSAVPGLMWEQVVMSAKIYARLPVAVWDTLADTVRGRDRGVDSPVSMIGIAQVSGEASARASEDTPGGPWKARLALWLYLGAAVNLALWLFNLLPLLPLDGGHVAGALWEGGRRTWARARGRASLPGAVDLARAIPLTYAVFGLLILMTAVLMVADIVNPVV